MDQGGSGTNVGTASVIQGSEDIFVPGRLTGAKTINEASFFQGQILFP
jgi:hypothetical protein